MHSNPLFLPLQWAAVMLGKMTLLNAVVEATGTSSCPVMDTPSPSPCERDVFIIGAGMSGVSAAREISENSDLTYAWAEARHEVGGRMRLSEGELCKVDDGTKCWNVEVGANWVSGGEGNPVFELLWEYDIEHRQMKWQSVTFYEDAKKVQNNRLPYESFQAAFDRLNEKAFECELDPDADGCELSARDYMRDCCDWFPETIQERFVEAYTIDYDMAADANNVSVINYPDYAYGYDFQDKDFFVDDVQGYKKVAEMYMAGGQIEPPCFNTEVFKVGLSDDTDYYPVKVDTMYKDANGNDVTGTCNVKKVISTLPVGYLLEHDDMFEEFDNTKAVMAALDKTFDMKLYYKIFFSFKSKFWENTEIIFIAKDQDPDQDNPEKRITSQCLVWQNLGYFKNSPLADGNILLCTLVTDSVNEISDDSGELDETDVDGLLDDLRDAYDVDPVFGQDYNYHYHPWKTDPYTFGSYEIINPGADLEDYFDATRPLVSGEGEVTRVHWAGSHACPRHFAFVHGAFAIGQAKAREVINELCDDGCDLDTTSICTDAPEGGYGNRSPAVRGN